MLAIDFVKGHGTRNDFVCIADPEGRIALTDEQLRLLCDRRAGIGADGTLRAVRARHVAGYEQHGDAWFMDYRNADASIAEMCGNGLRVFLRFLAEEGLIEPVPTTVVTRAGPRTGEFLADGEIRVGMGRPRIDGDTEVRVAGKEFHAAAIDVGNPHAAVIVDAGELAALDLSVEPHYDAGAFPAGANVEFVAPVGPQHVRMRVWERGVGETESCGTGTVAAAVAAARQAGSGLGSWRVDPPGGCLRVELSEAGASLTGAAVLVARGKVNL